MGFPLRLLAREIYDRVVGMKGAASVALLTGEERIAPSTARYVLCTAEAMPVDQDFAFVAVDEVQLGADPERGHVFTDRMLRARGREETMLLGSASATPMVRSLIPDADIDTRPRFSTLRYAGARKLSRLPKRSAIVAFSTEEVYAIAEMLRRSAGGAAVVMGALSPRTRNAQVAMFQSGEVDYLVATDAIGMGLNLDVAHIAFAGMSKFDGRRQRRLTLAEMAQIAGRAGRHQRDGTFGSVGGDANGFTPEEIEALENYIVPPLPFLWWRNSDLRFEGVPVLLDSLAMPSQNPLLRQAPMALDEAVLRRLADEPAVSDALAAMDTDHRALATAMLWDMCGLPDFQSTGADHHSRLVLKLWLDRISRTDRTLSPDWFASQMARVDRVDGDIDALSARIAAVRTLAYIAHQNGWLPAASGATESTRALEERLSDALHDALTARFVNRRTTVLLRDLKAARASLPVQTGTDGTVRVDNEVIGSLDGFTFRVDPAAKAADQRLLRAAAERHLGPELAARATALAAADQGALSLYAPAGTTPGIAWSGSVVATLERGRDPLVPAVRLAPAVRDLAPVHTTAILRRLQDAVQSWSSTALRPLHRSAVLAAEPTTSPALRALLVHLIDAGGVIDRRRDAALLPALTPDDRMALRKLGFVIGTLDIYHPDLLRPRAVIWRAALSSIARKAPMPNLPPEGAVRLPSNASGPRFTTGFRPAGEALLRIDMVERIARQAHTARALAAQGGEAKAAFRMDTALATSLGLSADDVPRLMRALGFRAFPTPVADAAVEDFAHASTALMTPAASGASDADDAQADALSDDSGSSAIASDEAPAATLARAPAAPTGPLWMWVGVPNRAAKPERASQRHANRRNDDSARRNAPAQSPGGARRDPRARHGARPSAPAAPSPHSPFAALAALIRPPVAPTDTARPKRVRKRKPKGKALAATVPSAGEPTRAQQPSPDTASHDTDAPSA